MSQTYIMGNLLLALWIGATVALIQSRFAEAENRQGAAGGTCQGDFAWSLKGKYGHVCVPCGHTCCQRNQRRAASDAGFEKRISHGTPAAEGEFPWSVAVFEKVRGRYKYICGGVLIGSREIATAHHCVRWKLAWKLFVTIGERDIKVNGRRYRTTDFGKMKRIKRIDAKYGSEMKSERYYRLTGYVHKNDMAVLYLDKSVSNQRICLRYEEDPPENPECVGIGHGYTETGNTISSVLRKTDVVLDFEDECLRNQIPNRGFFLCARHREEHAEPVNCQLDSGSPVVCRHRRGDACSSFYLAGIFSFNIGGNGQGCTGSGTVLADMIATAPIQGERKSTPLVRILAEYVGLDTWDPTCDA